MTALILTLAVCSVACLAVYGALRADEWLTRRRQRAERLPESARVRIAAMREREDSR